jgi:hypothetical protein
MGWVGMDWIHLIQKSSKLWALVNVVDSCEYSNEPSGTIISNEFD